MLRQIFQFLSRPTDTGVGVDNLALVRQYQPPPVNPYSPAYTYTGVLARLSPAMVKTSVSVPTVGIQGNGIGLHGQFAMTGLSQKAGS